MLTNEELKNILIDNFIGKDLTKVNLEKLGLTFSDYNKLVKNNLYYLVDIEEYEVAKFLLENSTLKMKNIIIYLLDTIIDIKRNNKIPTRVTCNSQGLCEAIYKNDFCNALRFANMHVLLQDLNRDENVIIHLCEKINFLIKQNSFYTVFQDNYELLIKFLDQGKINTIQFKEVMCNFLENTNNEKYEKLLLAFCNLDILIGDENFNNIKLLLKDLKNNCFSLKRRPFVNNFQECLERNDYDKAKAYLSIIEALEDIKEEHTLHKFLKQDLDKSLGQELTYEDFSNVIRDRNLLVLNKLVKKLYERKGLELIEEDNEETRLRIHNILKSYPNITSRTIDINGKKMIMISYVEKIFKPGPKMQRKIKILTEKNLHGKTIGLGKKLIAWGCCEALVYEAIGMQYLEQRKGSSAIKYLTIAYAFLKYKNLDTEQIERVLSDPYSIDYEKLNCDTIDEGEFNNDIKTYGINHLSDILFLIYENGEKIDDACLKFGLSLEEVNIVKLLIAIEEYRCNNDISGDYLVKQVEKSKEKNKIITNLFEEIKINKKFYKNRPNDGLKNLIYKR